MAECAYCEATLSNEDRCDACGRGQPVAGQSLPDQPEDLPGKPPEGPFRTPTGVLAAGLTVTIVGWALAIVPLPVTALFGGISILVGTIVFVCGVFDAFRQVTEHLNRLHARLAALEPTEGEDGPRSVST